MVMDMVIPIVNYEYLKTDSPAWRFNTKQIHVRVMVKQRETRSIQRQLHGSAHVQHDFADLVAASSHIFQEEAQ
jgi:hypothetical protein